MIKNILFLITTLISINIYSQTQGKLKEYKLFDKYQNADIDYDMIDSLGTVSAGINVLNDIFKVKSGNFNVYRFLNFDKGILYDEGPTVDIINLVIVKVDNKKKIVDGYYYSLTNPEMPSLCHLYKLVNKPKFRKKIDLRELIFKRINETDKKKYHYLDCDCIDY
jgi:hypothetical protein